MPARRRSRWILPGLLAGLIVMLAGAGAGAALESQTVGSFGQGVLWAIALMTTAGYIHGPPETGGGQVLSVLLMIAGFLMLSLVSAALAAIFVRDDTDVNEARDQQRDDEILRRLAELQARLDQLERRDDDSL
jgi:voltage-gated potassium channel